MHRGAAPVERVGSRGRGKANRGGRGMPLDAAASSDDCDDEPWVVCSEKFGNKHCREGSNCKNRKCGFAHPASWMHHDVLPGVKPTLDQELHADAHSMDATAPALEPEPSTHGNLPENAAASSDDCDDEPWVVCSEKFGNKHCREGSNCKNRKCGFAHPASWMHHDVLPEVKPTLDQELHADAHSMDVTAPALEPEPSTHGNLPATVALTVGRKTGSKRNCKFGTKCWRADCIFVHGEARPPPCPHGAQCDDVRCSLVHGPQRPRLCPRSRNCRYEGCDWLHPADWDPASPRADPEAPKLKSLEQRRIDRVSQGLPILAKQHEFIEQLKRDKVTVVVASTGSGKTTQLPQYAAENFDGLIVCTQPRALAAVDISKRIALEFDGTNVGENVGNAAGRRTTQGTRIMLMTDASFISMAQRDTLLSKLSVLIIDEAHERSLNTDIVLGIARRVRQVRQDDFHVVVASATIDPQAFVDFFGHSASVLNVPGRTHDVTLEYLPGESLVPACLDALAARPAGNLMAFLPGQREVDKAVKEFKAAAPSGQFLVLPLYGGLPSEEQSLVTDWSEEDALAGQRMVVFATNVAETSLTIPGIQLVVDTGLAKEARYDPERRTTLLEQVLVSRSSADQRKGRAGRVASGHCIRLYSDEDLIRPTIQPEILRSSLDKVVLQLVMLQYNPLSFEFITRPPELQLQASISVLVDLGCIDGRDVGSNDNGAGDAQHLASDFKITPRGRCFVDMDFDPRLSQFVATAAERFGREELAAEVAAILCAPGSVFFMGGTARKEAKNKISRMAATHESDLLLQREVYKGWSAAGADGRQGRRSRIAFAQTHGLNNRVLECVADTIKITLKKIQKTFSSATVSAEDSDLAVIGQCLLASFPEQLGQPLLPGDPSAGVFLLSNRSLRGTLSSTSVLVQNTCAVDLFITMNATMIPSGALMVDSNHPIDRSWLNAELNCKMSDQEMVTCWHRSNLNPRFEQVLLRMFKARCEQDDNAQEAQAGSLQFAVPQYDATTSTLRVLCPRSNMDVVSSDCDQAINLALRQSFEYEHTAITLGGTIAVKVSSGLAIESVESIGAKCRINFAGLPTRINHAGGYVCIDSDATFAKFLATLVNADDIVWSQFRRGNGRNRPSGVAIFASEHAAETACSIYETQTDSATSEEHGTPADFAGGASIYSNIQDEWTRTVQWTISGQSLDETTALEKIRLSGVVVPITLRSNRFGTTTSEFRIVIKNLPVAYDTSIFNTIKSAPSKMYVPAPKPGSHTKMAVLIYLAVTERDEAFDVLDRMLSSLQVSLQLPNKHKPGCTYTKIVHVQLKMEEKPGSCEFRAVFETSAHADNFCTMCRENPHDFGQARPEATVQVQHPECFKDLPATATSLAQQYGVAVADVSPKKHKQGQTPVARFSFHGNSASKCGKAAQRFGSLTEPLLMRVGDRAQSLLLDELHRDATLQAWAEELCLKLVIHQDDSCVAMHFEFSSGRDAVEVIASTAVLTKMLAEYVGAPARHVNVQISKSGGTARFKGLRPTATNKLKRMNPSKLGEVLGQKVSSMDVTHDGPPSSFKLYGTQSSQGVFMFKIGQMYDIFKSRYRVLQLDATARCLFRNAASAGAELLHDLAEEVGNCCSFTYDHRLRGIEIALTRAIADPVAIVADATARIEQLLSEHEQTGTSIAACSFCGVAGGRPFDICGHHYCRECLRDMVSTVPVDGVCCPTCNSRVAVRDMRAADPHVFDVAAAEAARNFVASCSNHGLALCPTRDCKGLVNRSAGYCDCASCGSAVCHKCGTIGDELHRGISCTQYAELMVRNSIEVLQQATAGDDIELLKQKIEDACAVGVESKPHGAMALSSARQKLRLLKEMREQWDQENKDWISAGLGQIIRRAQEYVEEHWDPSVGKITATVSNPGLLKGCDAMQRFAEAVKQLSASTNRNKELILSNAEFAWHGTGSEDGIRGICDAGFDPKRRRGQAYGRGEYFGVTPGISKGYCGHQKHMILALILHEVEESKLRPQFAYIVDNPVSWSLSYCLPVLVVSFGSPCWSEDQFFKCMTVPIDWGEPPAHTQAPTWVARRPNHTTSASTTVAKQLLESEETPWTSPWRWHWQKDGSGYEAYSDQFNACIEAAYEAQGGRGRFTTPPIVRYVDDKPQTYCIDFGANTQTNMCTNYVRRVVRKRVKVPTQAVWEYHDQQWSSYELLIQTQIESAFRAYSDGIGSVTVEVTFPGRPETYRLDFLSGKQTNTTSGETRRMRRK
eukprot:COSAG02_NODE_2473_length_8740_cov_335.972688_1_plen_2244_part_00